MQDCAEFEWLKQVTKEANIAFQGILKDNVLNRFQFAIAQANKPGLTLPDILLNIADGFSTKLRHITGSIGNKKSPLLLPPSPHHSPCSFVRQLRGPKSNLRVTASKVRPEVASVMAAAAAEAGAGDTSPKPVALGRTVPSLALTDNGPFPRPLDPTG